MSLYAGDPSFPTRFGTDVADTSDETGLFLKIFGGETFAAFSETVLMMDKHFVREIASGKSAQFPKTWKVSAGYHQAGVEMLGQDTDETERLISIDGLLVSHVAIYDLDDAMSHFEVRSRYTEELGRAIAREFDTNVMRAIVLTARDSSILGGGSATTSPFPSGQVITSSDVSGTLAATGVGAQWHEALRAMRIGAGGDNVPDSEPLWVVLPYNTFDSVLYATAGDATDGTSYFLYQDRTLSLNQSGNPGVTSQLMQDGIAVLRTNLAPQSDDTANSNIKAKYRGNFSSTLAVGWGRDAVGTTKLIGMGMEQTRDVRRQEDFIVAKIAAGHGPLRNELAWEFTA